MRRSIVIAVVAGVLALFVLRACTHRPARPAADDALKADTVPGALHSPGPTLDPAQARARNEALQAAIDVVQGYLEDLASDRPAQADARWQGGRPPPREIEHGIRTQLPARAVQVRTLAATGDGADVPRRVHVPARLRITAADGRTRLFDGEYDVTRQADGMWRIVDGDAHEAPSTR